ncbi:MAG: hypothetical protein AB8F74_18045 [Saprospiraceae bacterium]
MKKSLWIFATILLFFIGDRIGGVLLKKAVDQSQFRYSRMYTGKAASDILLVGNSRGLIFYQPHIEKITGKKTFNISYNGLPIDLAKSLVADYLDNYQPKKMIVDITMCDRFNNQMISGFNLYTPYSKNISELIQETDQNGFYAAKLSHLYRYNSELFQRSLFYLNKNDEDWLLDREINDFMVANVQQEEPYNIGFTTPMLTHLNDMVKNAQAKGVEVHLVINPYFPAFAKQIENLEQLKSEVERATGLKVKDYAMAVMETKGFADYQHLNKYGAALYLNQLLKDNILDK